MLGCKGLKTSCNQFYICRVLLEYIIVVSAIQPTKDHSMVFYSSIQEGAMCT